MHFRLKSLYRDFFKNIQKSFFKYLNVNHDIAAEYFYTILYKLFFIYLKITNIFKYESTKYLITVPIL